MDYSMIVIEHFLLEWGAIFIPSLLSKIINVECFLG
jgi:hypothetical protein